MIFDLTRTTMIQAPSKAMSETGDPLLLTPGPLTTSKSVKEAMLHDWGSRDSAFIRMNSEMRDLLLDIAGADPQTFAAIPIQGSGTFAIEAMLTTFVPRQGHILLIVNGAYGHRAKEICRIAGRGLTLYESPEDALPSVDEVEAILKRENSITHLFVVHCETTSGILNPIEEIARLARMYQKDLLVDSMSAFGALPLNCDRLQLTAVAASSNKCLQGVPGIGFVICNLASLESAKGNATSLVLDLQDQYQGFKRNGQWRFTPPTHAISAFRQAIEEFQLEGGLVARNRRYSNNCRILIEGMTKLGFKPLLSTNLQAPIIVTFRMPADPKFIFSTFYDELKQRGFVIYPGKLTVADSFRVGCIGALDAEHMHGFIEAVRGILLTMAIDLCAPSVSI
jgi:2-aminoethylphosphonate-pyruvate transaminase